MICFYEFDAVNSTRICILRKQQDSFHTVKFLEEYEERTCCPIWLQLIFLVSPFFISGKEQTYCSKPPTKISIPEIQLESTPLNFVWEKKELKMKRRMCNVLNSCELWTYQNGECSVWLWTGFSYVRQSSTLLRRKSAR